MKRTLIAATALSLAATLTGCGGGDEPTADPTPTTESPSPSATSPSATTTPEPTWDDKFSPAQMKRYRAARDRWLEFWEFYSEITRKGVDTPGARQGFEQYTMNPLGERSRFLDTYVRGGVRMEVAPEVLRTSAEKITQNQVDFNYCLDDTHSRTVNINGDVNPKPEHLRRLVTVQMVKAAGGWRTLGYLHSGKVRPCGKTAP